VTIRKKCGALAILISLFIDFHQHLAMASDLQCVARPNTQQKSTHHLFRRPRSHSALRPRTTTSSEDVSQSLLSPRIANEIDDVGFRSGTQIEWIQPSLALSKPESAFADGQLALALNLLVDSAPLDADVYIPTLDRVSMIYEQALYAPELTSDDDTSIMSDAKIDAARSMIFHNYTDDPNTAIRPSDTATQARAKLAAALLTNSSLSPATGQSFDDLLPILFEEFDKWRLANSKFVASAETLRNTYRAGISEALWEAKLDFESHLDLSGNIKSDFNPPITSWFLPEGWRLLTPGVAGGQSVWVKQVKISRPWMNLRLLKNVRAEGRRARALAPFKARVADREFRETALRFPAALVLVGTGMEAGGPKTVGIAAVVVQTDTF
jgi:hypothetical protein